MIFQQIFNYCQLGSYFWANPMFDTSNFRLRNSYWSFKWAHFVAKKLYFIKNFWIFVFPKFINSIFLSICFDLSGFLLINLYNLEICFVSMSSNGFNMHLWLGHTNVVEKDTYNTECVRIVRYHINFNWVLILSLIF